MARISGCHGAIDPNEMPRNRRQFTLIARLAPGATLEEANTELATIAAQTTAAHAAEFEEYQGWRLTATPWAEALMRDVRPGAWLLIGAVGLVLLIACANLSNLLLARSSTRQREMAVRLALGAARWRIARHLLAEVALLAVAGLGAGLLLAQVGLPALVSVVPAQLNTLGVTAAINFRVVGWAAMFAIGSAVLVALLPVFQSTRTSPQDALKSDGRGATAGRVPLRLRHSLIVAEIALSVMLLVGAGLFVRSFAKLQSVEPGFDPRNVLTMRITVAAGEVSRRRRSTSSSSRSLDRLEQTPGVRAVSVASQFPPQGVFSTAFRLDSMATRRRDDADVADHGGERDTLCHARCAARRRAGVRDHGSPRRPTRGDRQPGVRVEVSARRRRAGTPSVDRIIRSAIAADGDRRHRRQHAEPRHAESAVAGDLRAAASADAEQSAVPAGADRRAMPGAMLPAVRQQLASIDPDQPVYDVQTLEEAVAAASFGNRFSMILFAIFAAVALSLTAIGIYGVMSYAVSARTQEIGVRLAVGADRRDVMWLVLRQVLRLTAIGLLIGLAGVAAASGAIRRALFEVQPLDPVTIAAAAAVLGGVALFAGWFPAWRASRVDPVNALRGTE